MPQRHMLQVVRVKELARLGQAATTPHRREIGKGHDMITASAFASLASACAADVKSDCEKYCNSGEYTMLHPMVQEVD